MKYLYAILTAVIVSLSSYGLHSCSIQRIEKKHATELTSQQTALTAQCDADKALTEKVSNEYQNKIADLRSRADAARRLLNSCAVAVEGLPAAGSHAAGSPGEHPRPGAEGAGTLPAGTFIDLMEEAERYQNQVSGLQAYIQGSKCPRTVK